MAYAENLGKKVVCMYEKDKNVSGFIRGNNNLIQTPYTNVEELITKIEEIIK